MIYGPSAKHWYAAYPARRFSLRVCQKLMVSTHRVINEPLRKRESSTGHESILSHGAKAIEIEDIAARLAALERQAMISRTLSQRLKRSNRCDGRTGNSCCQA